MIALRAILLTLLLATAVQAFEEPEDFRGIPWGTSLDNAEASIKSQWDKRRAAGEIVLYTDIQRIGVGPGRLTSLMYSDKIGEIRTNLILWFLDEKFAGVSLSFPSSGFSGMATAFKQRYGAPSKLASRDYRTGSGARVTGQELLWDGARIMISLSQYSSKLTQSSGYINTVEYVKYAVELKRERDAKSAGDL